MWSIQNAINFWYEATMQPFHYWTKIKYDIYQLLFAGLRFI